MATQKQIEAALAAYKEALNARGMFSFEENMRVIIDAALAVPVEPRANISREAVREMHRVRGELQRRVDDLEAQLAAASVDPSSYSQEQVEPNLLAELERLANEWARCDYGPYGNERDKGAEDGKLECADELRAALAAAGVPALSDTMQKLMHQRENEQSDRIEAQHKRVAELEAQVAQSSGAARAVTDEDVRIAGDGWESVEGAGESYDPAMRAALEAFLAARRERSEPETKAAAPTARELLADAAEWRGTDGAAGRAYHDDLEARCVRLENAASVPAAPADGRETSNERVNAATVQAAGEHVKALRELSTEMRDIEREFGLKPEPSDADVTTWNEDDYAAARRAYNAGGGWVSEALDAVEHKLRAAFEAGRKAAIDQYMATRLVLVEPLNEEEREHMHRAISRADELDDLYGINVLRGVLERFPAPVVSQPEKPRETVEDVLREMRSRPSIDPMWADRIEAARARESENNPIAKSAGLS